jgi:hypothetical protein
LKEVRDTRTDEAKASAILGVLQQHRIMDEFIALKFEAHPAIVRELSLFIITERVDPQAIIRQGERSCAAEATVAKLEKAVTNLLESTATNKRHHDNLANDLRQFKATRK